MRRPNEVGSTGGRRLSAKARRPLCHGGVKRDLWPSPQCPAARDKPAGRRDGAAIGPARVSVTRSGSPSHFSAAFWAMEALDAAAARGAVAAQPSGVGTMAFPGFRRAEHSGRLRSR